MRNNDERRMLLPSSGTSILIIDYLPIRAFVSMLFVRTDHDSQGTIRISVAPIADWNVIALDCHSHKKTCQLLPDAEGIVFELCKSLSYSVKGGALQ